MVDRRSDFLYPNNLTQLAISGQLPIIGRVSLEPQLGIGFATGDPKANLVTKLGLKKGPKVVLYVVTKEGVSEVTKEN